VGAADAAGGGAGGAAAIARVTICAPAMAVSAMIGDTPQKPPISAPLDLEKKRQRSSSKSKLAIK
jgi:hypothetical protein